MSVLPCEITMPCDWSTFSSALVDRDVDTYSSFLHSIDRATDQTTRHSSFPHVHLHCGRSVSPLTLPQPQCRATPSEFPSCNTEKSRENGGDGDANVKATRDGNCGLVGRSRLKHAYHLFVIDVVPFRKWAATLHAVEANIISVVPQRSDTKR